MTRLLALALFLPVAAWGQTLINEPHMDKNGMLIVPDGPYRCCESPTTLTFRPAGRSITAPDGSFTVGNYQPDKSAPATITCHPNTPIRIQDEKGNVLFKIECP